MKVYTATIIEGYEPGSHDIFVSLDKEFVERWAERFNKIISQRREKFLKFEKYPDIPPFWYDYINHERPFARCYEIELRMPKQ